MKNNIPLKRRHKNTPTKQLISTVVARYVAASERERKSIIKFFDRTIQNTTGEFQNFRVEARARVLEIEKGGMVK